MTMNKPCPMQYASCILKRIKPEIPLALDGGMNDRDENAIRNVGLSMV